MKSAGKKTGQSDQTNERGKQSDYNEAVRNSDIVICLFATKVRRYTETEFDTAFKQLEQTGKPKIYTFFKNVMQATEEIDEEDFASLKRFQRKLKKYEHFYTKYDSSESLQLQLMQQFDMILDV